MSNIEISIYCASDRFNYGDLLFPIILEKFIYSKVSEVNIENYAINNSDLSSLGGLPTRSLKMLVDDSKKKCNHYIIVAGGDVLTAGWFDLYRYLLPLKFSFMCRVTRKLFGTLVLDSLVRRFYESNLYSPFLLSPINFSGEAKIIFNTVGGSGLGLKKSSIRKHVSSVIKESLYCSVRDAEVRDVLKSDGATNVRVAPDSAVIMSKFFSRQDLHLMICNEVRDIIKIFSQGFWCFQVSAGHSRGYIDVISAQIDETYHQFNIPVVLLPIGRASGHEDQVALCEISKKIRSPWRLPENIGVFDIMALIASSKLYAGTSLHGVITSTSFAVPRIGLTHKVPKLAAHLKCWDIAEFHNCVEFNRLAVNVGLAMKVSKKVLVDKGQELIGQAESALNELVVAIQNDKSIVSGGSGSV